MSKHHFKINRARWQRVRLAVFNRDGRHCRSCGKHGALECDHITPLDKDPGQDPYAMDGLQTLCRGCHIEKTRQENLKTMTAAEADWAVMVREMMG